MGMEVPAAIEDEPELGPGLQFIWLAFWELSTDRQIGMAEGPIPWSAMNMWALRHSVWGDDFDRFVLLIRSMDSVYIEHRAATHKKALSKAGKSKSTGKGFIKPGGRNG